MFYGLFIGQNHINKLLHIETNIYLCYNYYKKSTNLFEAIIYYIKE